MYSNDSNYRKCMIKRAKDWVKYIQSTFPSEIKNSIDNTVLFNGNASISRISMSGHKTQCVVSLEDTASALFHLTEITDKRVCALNFASYKKPGGLFLQGSMAQEECLCHVSTLYPVLSAQKKYYKDNKSHNVEHLYTNRALYTPDIVFCVADQEFKADVLTCAAPNLRAAKKYCGVSEDENTAVLISRCAFVLNAMAHMHVDIPVLGAYGCGVFGQNPMKVARIFKSLLSEDNYNFSQVIFAIPGGPNADAFLSVFGENNV